MTAKRIGIAVVEHAGHYLIGLRGPDVPLAGYSEFPGGKCQESESAEACAVRECLEETGMRVAIERLLLRHVHEYPPALVELHFFLCHPECDISLAAPLRATPIPAVSGSEPTALEINRPRGRRPGPENFLI